jgi:hypothetical protein
MKVDYGAAIRLLWVEMINTPEKAKLIAWVKH